MSDDLPILSTVEARVLGCLIEKKELTPDVYPLTLNSAHAAANQKTAREPVMALELTEIRRALSTLEQKGLVRQAFASRVERYEHLMAQRFSLTTPQIAIVGLLLLRGAQTAHELLARSERMARFASIEELRDNLDLMIGKWVRVPEQLCSDTIFECDLACVVHPSHPFASQRRISMEDYLAAEVVHAVSHEGALTVADVLERRTGADVRPVGAQVHGEGRTRFEQHDRTVDQEAEVDGAEGHEVARHLE